MPKQKTHKGSKKRFRVTAKGKLQRGRAGKGHLNSHKTGKRMRSLNRNVVTDDTVTKKIVKAMTVGGW